MISFNAWIFRKRKGFCRLHGLSKTNLVKTTFLSILAAVVVVSDLRNSARQSAQLTETEGRRIELFFPEQMFSALICSSFLS